MAAKLLTLWLLASAMVALANADEDVDFLRAQLRERDVKIAYPTPQKPGTPHELRVRCHPRPPGTLPGFHRPRWVRVCVVRASALWGAACP